MRLDVTLFVLCPVRYRDVRRLIEKVRRDPEQAMDEDAPSITARRRAGLAMATTES